MIYTYTDDTISSITKHFSFQTCTELFQTLNALQTHPSNLHTYYKISGGATGVYEG